MRKIINVITLATIALFPAACTMQPYHPVNVSDNTAACNTIEANHIEQPRAWSNVGPTSLFMCKSKRATRG